MKLFYYILAHVCYWIGHSMWLVTDFVAKVSPDENGLIDVLYSIYSKFMYWSGDFDKAEWVWLSKHENETDEEFNKRARERWPDIEE